MAGKLTKKEQAAADAEALRIAALPMPVAGEAYDPARHPSVLLDKAGLGVSYVVVDEPVLVPMKLGCGKCKMLGQLGPCDECWNTDDFSGFKGLGSR
jgi:hypothetical protein